MKEAVSVFSVELAKKLARSLSGDRAYEYVKEISQFHRVQASPGYSQAAAWVADRLRSSGVDEVKIERYRSDGFVHYGSWQSPIGWSVESAQLKLLTDGGEEVIADYAQVPMSLVTLSRSTDTVAELIDVGEGTKAADYKGRRVAGKIVLASGYGGAVHREAVIERGALGVVCYPSKKEKPDPEIIKYTGMWPRGEERGKVTWGFNISRDTAERLKKLLAKKKKVLLRAVVKGGELFDSDLEVVNAAVTGADLSGEEVLLMAHLCHPKHAAEDNASGSAAICDIACTISDLISRKGAKRPRRTLRFLWVPEMYGTMAYVSQHRSLARHTLACINCDMVGADPELTGSLLKISAGPDSLPSFLGDLLEAAAQWVKDKAPTAKSGPKYPFKYKIVPYALGSDDFILTDSTVGVYSTMFNRWPNIYHHTHKDTPEIVNPTELLRSEIIAALGALATADADSKSAGALLELVRKKGEAHLARVKREAHKVIAEAKRAGFAADYTLQLKRVYSAYRREVGAVESVLRLSGDEGLRAEAKRIEDSLWSKCDSGVGRVKEEGEARAKKLRSGFPPRSDQSRDQRLAERMVPRREVLGPVSDDFLHEHLPPKMLDWGELSKPEAAPVRYEAVNFINGQRNVLSIHDLLEGEFGACDLAGLIEYMRALERARLISVRRG